MRFTRIVVESFQAIQKAEVELGPGLNILYGPNDLGKSTLASAVRAALLVLPGSAEAGRFSTWYADASPKVSLTFVDGAGHHWCVTKEFGHGSRAELRQSKDGLTFSLDCTGRQVEEKLRGLLDWGIPAPGGRGAPRGLPQSFLSNVLLGSQQDVDGILAASLAEDPASTGRLRLSKALATLAQDPVFKKVLDAAQAEVDRFFSATGRPKKGQGSPFVVAADRVKRLQADLGVIQQQLKDSAAVEANLALCRDRYGVALAAAEEAKAGLAETRRGLEKTRLRQAARARLEEARTAQGKIVAHASALESLEAEVERLEAAALALEGKVARTEAGCADAAARLRAAEEAHRLAAGEEGARRREMKRLQLAERAAGLKVDAQKAETRKAEVTAATKAVAQARQARDARAALTTQLAKANEGLRQSLAQVEQAAADADLARAVRAHGRWHQASTAAAESAKAALEASNLRAQAERKSAEAARLDAGANETQQRLDGLQATLPALNQLKDVERLQRELEIAEASLGGGLSVSVRARGQTRVNAVVDGKVLEGGKELPAEAVLEADRSVRLAIGKLIDIEITAGALEKRKAMEALRARWLLEGQPVLERAGVAAVAQLVELYGVFAREAEAAVAARKSAEQHRSDAKGLSSQAALLEDQARRTAFDEPEIAARKAAIGPADPVKLHEQFGRLGKAWEAAAEALVEAKDRALTRAKAQVAEHEQTAKLMDYKRSEAEKTAHELDAAAAALCSALGTSEPHALVPAVEKELVSIAKEQAGIASELQALDAEGSQEVERAQRSLAAATRAVEAAEDARKKATAELEVARGQSHTRAGERTAARAQLEAMDLPAAERLLAQRSADLSALGADPDVSEADVEAGERRASDAQRLLELARQELHMSEGALSKVGGAAVREEAFRLEEALLLARTREREVEVDADAWKLLHETLRAVENEEGAHLGRALALPVTQRFAELTGGRYEALRLNAELQTEGLGVTGANTADGDVVSVLSVGTRDQLATLIRLAIAEQLKSAIVLDDHLVHTDPARLAWFRDVLLRTSLEAQVLVLTCRPEDYLNHLELGPDVPPIRDVAGGTIRALDLERIVKRWGAPVTATSLGPPNGAATIREPG